MWRPQVYFILAAGLIAVILWNGKFPLPDFVRAESTAIWLMKAQVICLVGAAYFSIRATLRTEKYHALNFFILLFFFAGMAMAGKQYLVASRQLHLFLYQKYKADQSVMESTTERALEGKTSEERLRMARVMFHVFGLHTAYKDDSGNTVAYLPTEYDRKEHDRIKGKPGEYEAAFKEIDGSLDRFPQTGMKILLLAGGIFLAFFGGDILWIVWIRP